jgi:hypothetical protein
MAKTKVGFAMNGGDSLRVNRVARLMTIIQRKRARKASSSLNLGEPHNTNLCWLHHSATQSQQESALVAWTDLAPRNLHA